METKKNMNPIALALGATAVGMLAAPAAMAAENPFSMTEYSSGYTVAGDHKDGRCGGEEKDGEGSCGEGKCGEKKREKCKEDESESEGKCGEGKCGGEEEESEGKCGEGKCG